MAQNPTLNLQGGLAEDSLVRVAESGPHFSQTFVFCVLINTFLPLCVYMYIKVCVCVRLKKGECICVDSLQHSQSLNILLQGPCCPGCKPYTFTLFLLNSRKVLSQIIGSIGYSSFPFPPFLFNKEEAVYLSRNFIV